jgi:hypothetical protein
VKVFEVGLDLTMCLCERQLIKYILLVFMAAFSLVLGHGILHTDI